VVCLINNLNNFSQNPFKIACVINYIIILHRPTGNP